MSDEYRTISRAIDEGHGYLVRLASGGREVTAKMVTIICDNPQCDCRDVTLELEPDECGWDEPSDVVQAVVGLDAGGLELLTDGCTPELHESLRAHITPALLSVLQERWRRVKLRAHPEAWKTQDWSWWEPGLMIRWHDANPGDFDDVIDVGGRRLLVDDMYCCAPRCSCNEVGLEFRELHVEDAADADAHDDDDAVPRIVVELSRWLPKTEDDGPLDKDLRVLWDAYSSMRGIRNKLKTRRQKLRPVGKWLHQQAESKTATLNETPATRKVGRNEPCPCGSGRKFKMCCGGPNAKKTASPAALHEHGGS